MPKYFTKPFDEASLKEYDQKETLIKLIMKYVMERPETPDPQRPKEPNADDAQEYPWFNEMVNAEKDAVMFDDL
ncbi:hypothetical protein Tco_0592165, partial [Tanacetum coccineum]